VADPRAFLSFDYDHDEKSKILFAGQAKDSSPTPFMVADWSSKSALPEAEWHKSIKEKINRCNLLIVLVGKYMATASGVAKEIKMATDQNVPVFGVYVNGGDTSSTLPSGLSRGRTYTWTWADVATGINMCMKEGKNK
jgi:hypothetical protein